MVILGIEVADCALPGRWGSLGSPVCKLVASDCNEALLLFGRRVVASIDIGRKVLFGAILGCER